MLPKLMCFPIVVLFLLFPIVKVVIFGFQSAKVTKKIGKTQTCETFLIIKRYFCNIKNNVFSRNYVILQSEEPKRSEAMRRRSPMLWADVPAPDVIRVGDTVKFVTVFPGGIDKSWDIRPAVTRAQTY